MARYDSPGFAGAFPGMPDGLDAGSLSNAQGSTGVQGAPDVTSGSPVIASVTVTDPFGSPQLAENRPTHDVTAGATSGFSDDLPAHGGVIMGGQDGSAFIDTGAGHGRISTPSNPDSMEG